MLPNVNTVIQLLLISRFLVFFDVGPFIKIEIGTIVFKEFSLAFISPIFNFLGHGI